MGSSSSVENNSKLITDITTKTLIRSLNICENDVSGIQLINMECDPTPEEIIAAKNSQACTLGTVARIQSGDKTPEPACFACVQSDITQDMILQFDGKCNGKTVNHTEVRKNIQNALEDQAKLMMKGFQTPASKTEAKNISDIITKLSSSITNETINKSLSKLSSAQILTNKGSGGLQSVITQTSAAAMTSDAIFSNDNTAKFREDLANEAKKLADLKQTGPIAALAEELGKTIRGVVDSITNIVGLPLRTIMMIIGLVIVLIVVGVLIWMMRKGFGPSSGTKVSSTGKGYGEGRLGFLGNLLSKKKK